MALGPRWRQLTLTLREQTVGGRKKGFYERKSPCARDWWAYDRAQMNEACDVLDSIRVGVDQVCLDLASYLGRGRGRGRPRRRCAGDLAKALLLQQYLGDSNRRSVGSLKLFSEKLGLASSPGYKDVERAYGDPDVSVVLLGFFDLTVGAVRGVRDFAIDGTGLSTSVKDNWESYLFSGKRRYSVFEKLVCVVGQRYGLVSGFRVLDSMHGHESPSLRPLVEEVAEKHGGLGLFCGDAAYISRDNCEAVAGLGGVPRLYPKKNTSLNSRGCRAYQDMLLSFIHDPQAWLEEYHRRYVCESTFSSLKRRCLQPLRRKNPSRRRQEVLARIIIYNLIRISYATWTQGLKTTLKNNPETHPK
jgi:transposase